MYWYESRVKPTRIYDSDEIVVDYIYDNGQSMIRVSQLKDGHFKDEHFCEVLVRQAYWVASKNSVEPVYRCSNCQQKPWGEYECTKCGCEIYLEEEDGA